MLHSLWHALAGIMQQKQIRHCAMTKKCDGHKMSSELIKKASNFCYQVTHRGPTQVFQGGKKKQVSVYGWTDNFWWVIFINLCVKGIPNTRFIITDFKKEM
jgi:hypothetical protein